MLNLNRAFVPMPFSSITTDSSSVTHLKKFFEKEYVKNADKKIRVEHNSATRSEKQLACTRNSQFSGWNPGRVPGSKLIFSPSRKTPGRKFSSRVARPFAEPVLMYSHSADQGVPIFGLYRWLSLIGSKTVFHRENDFWLVKRPKQVHRNIHRSIKFNRSSFINLKTHR